MSSLVKIANKINSSLRVLAKKNTEKQPQSDTFYWSENIWKFKTWELQIRYHWNFPIYTTFIT